MGNSTEERNIFGMQIGEWKKMSECGEVCGILGCENMPIVSCHYCGNWYCDEHRFVHFHIGRVDADT